MPADTVRRYQGLWTDFANITRAIAETRTVRLAASAQKVSTPLAARFRVAETQGIPRADMARAATLAVPAAAPAATQT